MLEHKVLNTADTIIVTSKTTKKEFEAITDKPIAVITNGYDVENIETQPLDKVQLGAYWFFSQSEIL
jgi:galactitol-specific phosphotransferase system IIB component